MKLDSALFERITADGHIPIGLFIFVVGTVVHWIHGLSADYVAFTGTILGFLGGHAWAQAKYEAKPDGTKTTEKD